MYSRLVRAIVAPLLPDFWICRRNRWILILLLVDTMPRNRELDKIGHNDRESTSFKTLYLVAIKMQNVNGSGYDVDVSVQTPRHGVISRQHLHHRHRQLFAQVIRV